MTPAAAARSIALIFALLLVSACGTLVRSPAPTATPTDEEAVAAFARVLDKFVNDRGEVDFVSLRDERGDLDRYVAYVGVKRAESLAGSQRLAHYINSYNALSMYNVLESDIPETHAGLAKLRFFVLRKLVIGGERRSLYSYENDIIRKLSEPRVHFALNCSALSCPTLPRVPFSAESLDQELQRESRRFFADARNLRVDSARQIVYLSEILRFYREDFVPLHAPSLIAYVNRYLEVPIPESYRVAFIDYDWTIANSRRARAP
jgi:hypothetical protein